MDTGERWYITGNLITVNGVRSNRNVTLTKTADEVITVKEAGRSDYFLFASRIANTSFSARGKPKSIDPSGGQWRYV